MIGGYFAAQMRLAGGGGTTWTPLNMATVPQIYLDMQDSTVTDVSGACSAISNLGAMGSGGDFSQVTSGSRPTIISAALNGNRAISFDGTDDHLNGGTGLPGAFRSVPAAWAFLVYKKRSADGTGTFRYVFKNTIGTSIADRFTVIAGGTGAGNQNKPAILGRRLDADSSSTLRNAAAVSLSYSMQLHSLNYSARTGRIYIDGALSIENTALTTSGTATSDTDANAGAVIGAYGGGSFASDIDLAAIISSNTMPSDSDIDKLFGWAAHKYGLTASLPGGHPYKSVAPTT